MFNTIKKPDAVGSVAQVDNDARNKLSLLHSKYQMILSMVILFYYLCQRATPIIIYWVQVGKN